MSKERLEKLIMSNYPRPKLVRDNYFFLDGLWKFETSPTHLPLKSLSKSITVPFSPETLNSGIYSSVDALTFLHYQISFDLFGVRQDKVLLNFQAVDQTCDVYLNDVHIGYHEGGYTSFSFDITNHIKDKNNNLYVVANDKTELSPYGRGKQRFKNNGKMSSIFYTPVSGIWQSVWIEFVPQNYIESLDMVATLSKKTLDIQINTNKDIEDCQITVFNNSEVIFEKSALTNTMETLVLNDIEAWSPNNPKLYSVLINYGDDEVLSYAAFRSIVSKEDSRNILRFHLNDEPIFMSGVLDQGYWPKTLLTPPNDEALINDIQRVKEMGFNTIRKHVKVESERFYYHCDRLGMLVWQDIPNGGSDYNFKLVTYLPNISDYLSRKLKDSKYGILGRKSDVSRSIYYQELNAIINQLKHYPSIVIWVPFNEGWGQFDARIASEKITNIDNTRLINEACGWFDQGGGDIFSIHSYFKPLKVKPKSRVIALSEFGGHALAIPGHTYGNKNFGYRKMDSTKIDESYKSLYNSKVLRNIESGMSAAIITQLSDVYNEINGLVTFDREVSKVSNETMQTINNRIYAIHDSVTKNFD